MKSVVVRSQRKRNRLTLELEVGSERYEFVRNKGPLLRYVIVRKWAGRGEGREVKGSQYWGQLLVNAWAGKVGNYHSLW